MIAWVVLTDEDDVDVVGGWTNRDTANRVRDEINKPHGYGVYFVEAVEVDEWSADEAIAKVMADYE